MIGRWEHLAVVAVLGLMLIPAPGQTAMMSITPPVSTVAVGDAFSVNVHVAGAVDLTSWQFDLAYDPSLLHADFVTGGAFLQSFGTIVSPPTSFSPGVIDNNAGEISLVTNASTDFPPLPNGDGDLAIVHFKAFGLGTSPLQFRNIIFNDVPETTVINANVNAVPLPGTAALMGAGGLLFLLIWKVGRWRLRPGTVA
jgi:hypothetical protein